MRTHYKFKRGEPVDLSVDITGEDAATVTAATAKLKKAGPNGSIVESAPVIITFTTQARTGGFDFLGTTTVPVGIYVADASFTLTSGGPAKSDTIVIEVVGSVT